MNRQFYMKDLFNLGDNFTIEQLEERVRLYKGKYQRDGRCTNYLATRFIEGLFDTYKRVYEDGNLSDEERDEQLDAVKRMPLANIIVELERKDLRIPPSDILIDCNTDCSSILSMIGLPETEYRVAITPSFGPWCKIEIWRMFTHVRSDITRTVAACRAKLIPLRANNAAMVQIMDLWINQNNILMNSLLPRFEAGENPLVWRFPAGNGPPLVVFHIVKDDVQQLARSTDETFFRVTAGFMEENISRKKSGHSYSVPGWAAHVIPAAKFAAEFENEFKLMLNFGVQYLWTDNCDFKRKLYVIVASMALDMCVYNTRQSDDSRLLATPFNTRNLDEQYRKHFNSLSHYRGAEEVRAFMERHKKAVWDLSNQISYNVGRWLSTH